MHDEWYPSLLEIGDVGIRGLTRAKMPKEVFGIVDITEVWQLALRFHNYDHLFSHRSYVIRRQRRDAQGGD